MVNKGGQLYVTNREGVEQLPKHPGLPRGWTSCPGYLSAKLENTTILKHLMGLETDQGN